MTGPDLLAFIREYDILFLAETMKSNDYTLVLPRYKIHHVSRASKHGIGIIVANKSENILE